MTDRAPDPTDDATPRPPRAWTEVDPLAVQPFDEGDELVAVRVETAAYDAADQALAQWDREQAQDAMKRMDAHIGELRAVLAPLLDNPLLEDANAPGAVTCVVCRRYTNYYAEGDWRPRAPLHEDGCPVLRRDELLGRP